MVAEVVGLNLTKIVQENTVASELMESIGYTEKNEETQFMYEVPNAK